MNPPIRKRKSTPRSRTGCQTCRTRKIRCAEQKPSCQQCLRSKWACPGYPPSADTSHEASSRQDILTYHLPFSIPGTQGDRKALHYFSFSAAADIGGYFSADFWSRSILQRCQHDAPVRYAVAGLACVHREYVASSAQATFEASCEAVSGYVRAMKALRRYVRAGMEGRGKGEVDVRVVMMCCAAFFCFELIRGEQAAALRHLRSGVSVLQQWQKGCEGSGSAAAVAIREADRAQLVDVFGRMDLQASAFDDGSTLTSRKSRLNDGGTAHKLDGLSISAGPNVHAAKYSLLLRRCFDFLVEKAPRKRSTVAEVPIDAFSARDGLLDELKDWDEHLDGLKRGGSRPSHLSSAIARSRFHSTMIRILIEQSLPSKTPAASHGSASGLDDKADELLQLADDAIGDAGKPGDPKDAPSKRHFCLHLGIVAPLFLLALKTSRAEVLTSCLVLLRRCKGRREGLYDADVVAQVIEAVMRQSDGVNEGSLLDQMGENAVVRLQRAVEGVVPARDDGARRVRGLCRLLAMVG